MDGHSHPVQLMPGRAALRSFGPVKVPAEHVFVMGDMEENKSNGDIWIVSVVAKGIPARLVYYADENHWILKGQNSKHWYGEVLGWLARYLK